MLTFLFYFIGLGSVFTYMVALNTNVINFDSKYRGLIIGTLNCFFAGSPSVFSVVYYKGLTGVHKFGYEMCFRGPRILNSSWYTFCYIRYYLYNYGRSMFLIFSVEGCCGRNRIVV